MKINLASVFVDDQDKALKFYTETLGFVKKTEMPVGEFRWLTAVSPEDPGGVELVLAGQRSGGEAVQERDRRRRYPVHLVRRR
jgi:catechol 2,3-dioxygenase-like lactoylglutathione lyase family enzyme